MRDFSVFKDRKNYTQSTESSLHLIWIPGYATGKLMKDRLGYGYESIIGIHRNDYVQWLYDKDDLKNITERLILELEGDPKYLEKIIKLWEKDLADFKRQCLKMEKTILSDLSDRELLKTYIKFVDSYSKEWAIPIIADAISLHSESVARHGLIELLKQDKNEKEFTKYFPVLTSPINVSFANAERRDLLRIALKIKKSALLVKIKKIDEKSAVGLLIEDPLVSVELEKHAKSYHWIQNSYLISRDLKPLDFANELIEIIKEGKDPSIELRNMESGLASVKRQKKEYLKKLGVSGRLKLVYEIIERFAWWQDERKKQNLIGDHFVCKLLNEFAKRLNASYFEVVYCTPSELIECFKSKKLNIKLMRERRKYSIMAIGKGFEDVFIGKEAERLEKLLLAGEKDAYDDIRGQCASIGRVEGYVRIVNSSKDIVKMKKGDVLVSSMTRPELVPAMKKASAIVTDEGGITSHAAIVSRELGIPCIIGTRIATKVLKDGDFVEVNANHGVVRKVN